MEKHFESFFINKYRSIEDDLTIDKRLQILVSISALVSMGNHDFLKSYLEYALSEHIDIEELQEVVLQTYLFAGFPAAIEGFIVLKSIQSEAYSALNRKAENDIDLWTQRGKNLCEKIYANNFTKMMKNIQTLNPDLADWMIYEGYGKVLSRSGLKPVTREFCAVSSLSVLGWSRQLYSHCKGAINLGASKDDVISVMYISELFKSGVIKKFQFIINEL